MTRSSLRALRSRAAAVTALVTMLSALGGGPAAAEANDQPSPSPSQPDTSPAPSPPATSPAAPTPSPSPSSDPSRAPYSLTMQAAPDDGGVLTNALTVTARLSNIGVESTPVGALSLRIGSQALATAADMSAWLAKTGTLALIDVATSTVPAIAAGDGIDEVITAPRTSLGALGDGVYPVQVTYQAGTETITDHTVITVSKASVSVLVPMTAPAGTRGVPSIDTLTELTSPTGSLSTSLAVAHSSNAIVAVDPALIAAMRALGTTAPESVSAWLAEFDALPNDVIELRFGDVDVNTLVAAGMPDLAPTSLSRYIDAAGFGATDATPAPTADIPTTAELLEVPNAHTDYEWPYIASADTAKWVAQAQKTLIVSSTQVEAAAPHATIDGAPALVYDAALSNRVSLAMSETDTLERNDDLAVALANAALTNGDQIFVALTRGFETDVEAALETVDTLTQLSNGRLTGEHLLTSTTPVAATFTPAPVPVERAEILLSLLDSERPLADMAVVLSDPTLLTGGERAEIMQLFSTAWLGDDRWQTAIADHRAAVELTLDAIEIEPISTIQFLSSGSSIPLRVRNDLPFTASLKLWAQPDDFRLTVASPTIVDAQAGTVTKVMIPVTAGLGNGDVTIRFWLTSMNDDKVAQPMFTEVRVRAEWERFAIVGFASVLVILIGGGLWRTIRKRRRRVAADAAGTNTPTEGIHG